MKFGTEQVHTTLVVVLTDGTHRTSQYFGSNPGNYDGGLGRALYDATRSRPANYALLICGSLVMRFEPDDITREIKNSLTTEAVAS